MDKHRERDKLRPPSPSQPTPDDLTEGEVNEFWLRLAEIGKPEAELPFGESEYQNWRTEIGFEDSDFTRLLFRL